MVVKPIQKKGLKRIVWEKTLIINNWRNLKGYGTNGFSKNEDQVG